MNSMREWTCAPVITVEGLIQRMRDKNLFKSYQQIANIG